MAYFDCIIGGGSGDGSTLTVTCYSGFAGLTISITNGVDTFSDVCPSTSPYEVVFEGLVDGTWTISTVYSGQTYTKTVEIDTSTTFNPIPNGATVTPTDDIQTWLHCADIWDKNYTTIAQVLADASILQAVIASNNAADYMARSTTWASDVCADANAMVYIGANDYCADMLLANSTWLNAIANSEYFKIVLNVKVPTMTSDTTPSGVVTYSNQYNAQYPAYAVFDGVDSNYNTSGSRWASRVSPAWVQYQFPNNCKIYKYVIKAIQYSDNRCSSCTIEVSNGGSLETVATIALNQTVQIYPNTDTYLDNEPIASNTYKFSFVKSSTYVTVGEIELYGRAAN